MQKLISLIEGRNDRNFLGLSFIICFLYISPFIHADFYYADDLARAVDGGPGWQGLGRPLSNLLMQILSFNGATFADVSPLPQILSAALLALTIYVCSRCYFSNKHVINVILFTPILLNPFYLQNISFQYDSLPMTLGVCLSVFAVLLTENNTPISFFLSLFLLIVSLCLYQPTINIYIGFLAISLILGYYHQRPIVAIFFKRCAILLVSLSAYTTIIPKLFLYSKSMRGNTVTVNAEGIKQVAKNIENFFHLLNPLMHSRYSVIFFPLIGFIFIAPAYLAFGKKILGFDFSDLFSRFLVLISPAIVLISYFGPLCFLKNPSYDPRVFIGLGGVIVYSFICSFILYNLFFVSMIIRAAFFSYIFLLLLFSFSLCFSYVNATKAQAEHDRLVMSYVLNDILNDSALVNSKEIRIGGVTGYDKIYKTNERVFPVIALITQRYSSWRSAKYLQSFGLKNVVFNWNWLRNEAPAEFHNVCEAKILPIINNPFFEFYFRDEVTYIWLKGNSSMCSG